MKISLLLMATVIFLIGCSTRNPLPDVEYFSSATTLNHMKRCANAGYIADYKSTLGHYAMWDILNTWEVDGDRFKNALNEAEDRWKGTKARETWCDSIAKSITNLRAQANRIKQNQVRNNAQNQQAWQNMSNSIKKVSQSLQEAGKQSLSTANSINVTSPSMTLPKTSINLNALPAPEGYQKTYVPSGSVGVLRNTSFSNGARLCEYSNGQATRLPPSQICPSLLKP